MKIKQAPSNWKRQRPDQGLPVGFMAAMRLNALQRGVKWLDTYDISPQADDQ